MELAPVGRRGRRQVHRKKLVSFFSSSSFSSADSSYLTTGLTSPRRGRQGRSLRQSDVRGHAPSLHHHTPTHTHGWLRKSRLLLCPTVPTPSEPQALSPGQPLGPNPALSRERKVCARRPPAIRRERQGTEGLTVITFNPE